MISILVTGGAGYIGSHACKALALSGYLPIAFDDLSTGHEWAVRWGPLEVGDVCSAERLDEVFTRYRPRAVLHFAGSAYVGESVHNPWKYYRNNTVGTLCLLEAMKRHSVSDFVFSSTCSTYGLPLELPIKESHPQAPINPYGRSKLMIEQLLADVSRSDGIRYVVLRYFNAGGADPDLEIGELHEPETHLIPLLLQVAANRRDSIDIFGTDYSTSDGTAVRDYVHVTDLANAHVSALEYLRTNASNVCLNLGTGSGHSVLRVVREVERVTGREIRLNSAPRREGDPPTLVADPIKAMGILNWSPVHSSLQQIIETAWRWHIRPKQ